MSGTPPQHNNTSAQSGSGGNQQASTLQTCAKAVQTYAKAVQNFSRLPTGTGQNHERLARFLSSVLISAEGQFQANATNEPFLTVYRFHSTQRLLGVGGTSTLQDAQTPGDGAPRLPTSRWDIGNARHFGHCSDYATEDHLSGQDSPGQVLFLRGYPSPLWLGLIGSTHHVDPEMFSRWLDFRSVDDSSNNFSLPALPSAGWNLLELPIVTIGSSNSPKQNVKQGYVTAARRDAAAALKGYHDQIHSGLQIPVGSSIVRGLCVFDETNFALEQRVTICMQPQEGDKGWLLLVWIDSNNCPEEDLLSQKWASALRGSFLWPVVRYKPNMGLMAHLMHKDESLRTVKSLQSASLVHLDYGRSLRPNVMAHDPFYALNDILTLAAASEKQFLNLLEYKLNQYMAEPDHGNFDGLPDLKYLKETLFRHISQLQRALFSIQNTKEPKWPKPVDDVGKRARSAIEQDYNHLYDHAQTLNTRCQEAISVLMNSIAILESQKAISQAERVGKLTFLAFIFVPLSFTTSFFGMDLKELGSSLSIWTWFVMTIPIMVFTLVLFFCDVLRYWNLGTRKIVQLFRHHFIT